MLSAIDAAAQGFLSAEEIFPSAFLSVDDPFALARLKSSAPSEGGLFAMPYDLHDGVVQRNARASLAIKDDSLLLRSKRRRLPCLDRVGLPEHSIGSTPRHAARLLKGWIELRSR